MASSISAPSAPAHSGRPSAGVRTGACDMDVLARVGRALANDTRRQILVLLLAGEACPSDLADEVGTTLANVSNHLTCLRGCGLVVGRPQGRHVQYRLVDGPFRRLLGELGQLDLRERDVW